MVENKYIELCKEYEEKRNNQKLNWDSNGRLRNNTEEGSSLIASYKKFRIKKTVYKNEVDKVIYVYYSKGRLYTWGRWTKWSPTELLTYLQSELSESFPEEYTEYSPLTDEEGNIDKKELRKAGLEGRELELEDFLYMNNMLMLN